MRIGNKNEIAAKANASSRALVGFGAGLSTHYDVECRDKNGNLKWTDEIDNLVVTAGLNDNLTQYFKGSSYNAAWFIGLTGATPTFAAADTMTSHSGWAEVTAYSETYRQTLTLGTASAGSIDNTASKAVFTISSNGTAIGGAFLATSHTKSEAASTLYGGGAFTGGNKTLSSGDTLTVTITLTATAS